MDITTIAKMMNLNPQQVLQAWSAAQKMGAGVKTREQALNLLAKNGIDIQVFEQYINHPMASMVASMTGVNLEQIKKDYYSLKGGNSPKVTNTSIEKYRQGFKQL